MKALDEAEGIKHIPIESELPQLPGQTAGIEGFNPRLSLVKGIQDIAAQRRGTIRKISPASIPNYMKPNAAWISKEA